jgi:mRNA-degrading endonuclease RelE of RelBE toxin-antitoxin system
MPFQIDLAPDALEQVTAFRKFDQVRILEAIRQQLSNDPLALTRHKKLMRSNLIAAYELRVGDFRVYYDVDAKKRVVSVRTIGLKVRNRVIIGGEEMELP